MAEGKVYINPTQLAYDKALDEVQVLLPGNSDNPDKIIHLRNMGSAGSLGSGTSLDFNNDETEGERILVGDTAPGGIRATGGQSLTLKHTAALDAPGLITLDAVGNPDDEQVGVIKLKANGVTALAVEVTETGAIKIGAFLKADAARAALPAAIADATDAPSAITQLNLALAALRTLGWLAI